MLRLLRNFWWRRQIIQFSEDHHFKNTRIIFSKSIYLFFLIKWITHYPGFHLFFKGYLAQLEPSWRNIFRYPWASEHYTILFWMLLILVAIAIFMRPSFWWATLVFWIDINFYYLIVPVKSGEEMVINLMLFANIFISMDMSNLAKPLKTLGYQINNFAVLLVKIQIGLIYFVSGWDKLMSVEWRSGDAIRQLFLLETYIHPAFLSYQPPEVLALLLAWATILFEIFFIVLVFLKPVKKWIIITGIIFHTFIATFLSLPFFAIAIITSYTIFLKDETAKKILDMMASIKQLTTSFMKAQ